MKKRLSSHTSCSIVKIKHPHEIWPPKGDRAEILQLSKQRNIDISIKGKVGPIKIFEDKFKEFLDNKVKYSVTFNSGTSSLLAAYFALGIEEDDEVIGPALTYHAALSPVFFLKGNVRLVDIDLNTRCIDVEKIEKSITSKTKVITVVHQWGHPADMDLIMKIAKKHNLKVLEDCSHAHGSKYKGKLCGTFGDVAIFSLQTNKMIFAGEGGILVTNNKKIYNRATLLGHYRDRSKNEIVDREYSKYWVTGFGLKLRMSPFNAIVAINSLEKYPMRKIERHKCLNYFNNRLGEINYIRQLDIDKNSIDMGAWYGFKPIYVKEKLNNLSRDILLKLLRDEGVEVDNPSAPLLARLPLYSEKHDLMYPNRSSKIANQSANYPIAQFVEENALSFPTFWNWTRDKKIIDQYIDVLKKIQLQYE